MNRHFLILQDGRGNHTVVYLVQAPTLLAAIQRYIREELDERVIFAPDGSVVMPGGGKTARYPHPLACIEAREKALNEWQIRELPAGVWEAEFEDLICGENAGDVEWHVARCLPVLRKEFPRARPPAFVWYLQDGALVTFYRRRRPFEIEVLRRYLSGRGEPGVRPWTGTYDDILDQLWQRWDWLKQGLVGANRSDAPPVSDGAPAEATPFPRM